MAATQINTEHLLVLHDHHLVHKGFECFVNKLTRRWFLLYRDFLFEDTPGADFISGVKFVCGALSRMHQRRTRVSRNAAIVQLGQAVAEWDEDTSQPFSKQ